MTKALEDYLKNIKEALSGWEPADINDTVSYYEEFIEDALEQGLSEKQILKKLGKPKQLIKTIKTENNIRRTEVSPGPLGLFKSIIGIPFLKASIVTGAIVPIVTAYLLYILSVVSYAAIAGGILFCIYAIRQIDPQYTWSIIGMAGMAFISTAVFGFFAFLIWRIANLITLHTMKLLRKFLNKDRGINKDQSTADNRASRKRVKGKRVALTFLFIFAIGVLFLIPSGLPVRYFSIWNSRMPYKYTVKKRSFPADEIKTISVKTLNSQVILKTGDSDKVAVQYQQPDWMTGIITKEGTNLSFTEKPNGRLPYMYFVSRHEGMTSAEIDLPALKAIATVRVQTNGGTVEITQPVTDLYNISANARAGKIIYEGRVLKSGSFFTKKANKSIIYIKNKNGKIIINPIGE